MLFLFAWFLHTEEVFAFHGTLPDTVKSIMQQGFDERLVRSNSGLYGAGLYFTPSACKAHQYTSWGLRAVPGVKAFPPSDVLSYELWGKDQRDRPGRGDPEVKPYILLCRAVLGRQHLTTRDAAHNGIDRRPPSTPGRDDVNFCATSCV